MTFEQISKTSESKGGFGYLSFQEMLKNSPKAKQGIKDFRERTVPKSKSIEPVFVKKLVSYRDWDRIYSQNNTYCNLGTEGVGKGKKVKIGFLTTYIPQDCELCTDKELMQIDDYRRAHNIFPTPLEKISKKIMLEQRQEIL